jgi:hypothetical protein
VFLGEMAMLVGVGAFAVAVVEVGDDLIGGVC